LSSIFAASGQRFDQSVRIATNAPVGIWPWSFSHFFMRSSDKVQSGSAAASRCTSTSTNGRNHFFRIDLINCAQAFHEMRWRINVPSSFGEFVLWIDILF